MGKRERVKGKLNAWLGRGFKTHQLKALLGLTVSRLAVLRNHRRARCDHARADVAELLRQGQQERALLRAEYAVKEQNMMDAFAMIESYCNIVTERASLLENQRDCPDELREAISGLLFAESRCGNLPELREVRSIFTSRLGKEFVAAAIELRNKCGVNTRLILKLSTKPASLESRMRVTKEIAEEIGGVDLQLDQLPLDQPSTAPEMPTPPPAGSDDITVLEEDKYLSETLKMRKHYKDAASAAQAAFESAAYAAAAARAAVELSTPSESQDKGGPGDGGKNSRPIQVPGSDQTGIRGIEQKASYATREEEKEEEEDEESESEEEGAGGEDVDGNLTRRRQFDENSEGDAFHDEVGATPPQTAAAAANLRTRRSPESAHGGWENSRPGPPHEGDCSYGNEEEEDRQEERPAAFHGGKSAAWGTGDRAPPVNEVGGGKGPVSVRTRRRGS